nr:glycoside hydrolase family 38 C-terminal domain-containing protein [Candidatus Njordarchaeota archaeon]
MTENSGGKRKQEKRGSNDEYDVVYFVNHSHMDNTWGGTPQECLDKNLEILDEVLKACKEQPEFCFSQENVYPLYEFVSRYPECMGEVSDLLKSGKLEVGGEYIQPTVDYCFDECVTRNLCYGKGWLKRSFDHDTQVVYEEDVPGHTLQMPQLLRKAGVRYFKISRGPPSIFRWVGPDGSDVLTYLAEYSWSHHALLGESSEETLARLPEELRKARSNYKTSSLMIPDGDDWTPPNLNLIEIVKTWNGTVRNPKLKIGTVQEFLSSVVRKQEIPATSGDMPNQWVGVSAIEAEAIRRLRAIQNMIFSAEEFMSISSLLGNVHDFESIGEAWRRILLTADHNWGGKDPSKHGEFCDEEKLGYIREARTICKKQLERALEKIAAGIDTTKSGKDEVPLLVFNQLPWPRTDIVELEIDSGLDPEKIQVSAHDGAYVPSQASVIGDGEGRKVRLTFVAEEIPPTGYRTYFIKSKASSAETETLLKAEENILENRYFRLEIDPKGRGIAHFFDKERGIEIGGERLCKLGPMKFNFILNELFGLGLKLSVKRVPTVKDRATDLIIADPTGEIFRVVDYPCVATIIEDGPVKATVRIDGKFIESARRQEITIYDKLKRVDLTTSIDWNGKNFVAMMLMFPLNLESGSSTVINVPYGVTELTDVAPGFWVKPTDPIQFKVRGVQHWVDVADSGGGATILTNWPCFDFTMAQGAIILWSMDNEKSFFSGERYRQKGIHTLTFSIIPHRGGWRMSEAYRQGLSLAFPLISLITSQHSAELPKEMSFVRIEARNVVMTALKQAEDGKGLILRMYEAEGLEKFFEVEFFRDIEESWETSLLEENRKKLTHRDRRVNLSISPYEIKTIRVMFKGINETQTK